MFVVAPAVGLAVALIDALARRSASTFNAATFGEGDVVGVGVVRRVLERVRDSSRLLRLFSRLLRGVREFVSQFRLAGFVRAKHARRERELEEERGRRARAPRGAEKDGAEKDGV
jgi:hypothetical protein